VVSGTYRARLVEIFFATQALKRNAGVDESSVQTASG